MNADGARCQYYEVKFQLDVQTDTLISVMPQLSAAAGPQSCVPQVSQVPLPTGLRVLECRTTFCEDHTAASESSVPTHMRSEASFEVDAQPVTHRTGIQLLQLCATVRHDGDSDASDDLNSRSLALHELLETLRHDSDNDASDDVNPHSLALHQPGTGRHAAFVEGGRSQLRSTAPCFVPRFGPSPWQQQQQSQQRQSQLQKQKQNHKQKQNMCHSQMQLQAALPCRQARQLLQPDVAAHHSKTRLKPGYQQSARSHRAATSRPSASAPQWTPVQNQTSQGTIYQPMHLLQSPTAAKFTSTCCCLQANNTGTTVELLVKPWAASVCAKRFISCVV